MNHEVKLSEFQRGNLLKLANGLWNVPQGRFGMSYFECGTVACACGHGPRILGIPKACGETFMDYGLRIFGAECNTPLYFWCFGGGWAEVDDTPRGAAQRILYVLRHGIPGDSYAQRCGNASLCYTQEQLPDPSPVTPAASQRLGFVANVLSEATAK